MLDLFPLLLDGAVITIEITALAAVLAVLLAFGAGLMRLSPYRAYRDVIIPQAIPPVVPALGNYLVAMFKDTPLLSAIAVVELMQRAKIIGSETFRYLEPITLVGVFFLVMSLVAAAGVRHVEDRLKHRWR